MLERAIIDGVPFYKDKNSNILYIYDTEQIAVGTVEDGRAVLKDGWRDTVKGRLDDWRTSLKVRERAAK